ncbi:PleD family two-component system response regulator [Chloroflexota bacterium]
MSIGAMGKSISNALVGLIKEAKDTVEITLKVTRDTTAHTLRGIRRKKTEAPRLAQEAVESAIRAGSEVGTELNSVTKGAVIGAIQGVSEVTKVTTDIVRYAAWGAVKATGEVGGDVVMVAKKAVEGAIEAGKQVGMEAEDAASAAAAGAVGAAGEISEAAATAVTKSVTGTIAGIRVVLKSPFKRPIILVLDSNRANLELVSQQLVKEGYETVGAASLEELDNSIQEKKNIDLALIDLLGFDQHIWERCEALREAKIPFIVISPQRSPIIQRDSMKHGASGLLIKPIGIKELMEYVHTSLGE